LERSPKTYQSSKYFGFSDLLLSPLPSADWFLLHYVLAPGEYKLIKAEIVLLSDSLCVLKNIAK